MEEKLKIENEDGGNNVLADGPTHKHEVTLCWATKKRHISVDGVVLCNANHTTAGYSTKNGGYNSLYLSGIPTHFKNSDDSKTTHSDGIVSYMPLDKQPFKINRRSICIKCQNKYDALWRELTKPKPCAR